MFGYLRFSQYFEIMNMSTGGFPLLYPRKRLARGNFHRVFMDEFNSSGNLIPFSTTQILLKKHPFLISAMFDAMI
jgi:hypothetical protein